MRGGGGAGGEEALPVEACPELAEGTELALEMVERALARGHLKAGWVAADDAFGISPSFREGLASLGMNYVLDVLAGFTVWPVKPEWTTPAYQGRGGPQAQAGGRTAAYHGGARR